MGTSLKKIRAFLWVLVAIAIIALGLQAGKFLNTPPESPATTADIGGTFQMTNQHGKAVTEKDFLGKPTLYFFGFTYCPAICPGAMADMTAWLEKLKADATKINMVFVSLDPERDTPEVIKKYLADFDARIIGLTGTTDEVAAMAKAYRVYYKKMPPMPDGGYMVDHSATHLLFDADGKLVSTLDMNDPRDVSFAKIEKALKNN